MRCHSCKFERLDGQPCNTAKCLCRCHRIGVVEAERLEKLARDASKPRHKRTIAEALTIPVSFEEEVKAGVLDPPPSNHTNVIQFPGKTED